jgi:hypothetical protein
MSYWVLRRWAVTSVMGAGIGLVLAVVQLASRAVIVRRLVTAGSVDELLSVLMVFRRVHDLAALLVAVSWLVSAGTFAAFVAPLRARGRTAGEPRSASAGGVVFARLGPYLSVPLRRVSSDERGQAEEQFRISWLVRGWWLAGVTFVLYAAYPFFAGAMRVRGDVGMLVEGGQRPSPEFVDAVLEAVDRSFMITRDSLAVVLLAVAVLLHGVLVVFLARRSRGVGPHDG